jgi:hypothetical protein
VGQRQPRRRALVGDIDGDGRTDLIVWAAAANGTFYWLPSSGGYEYPTARARQWGNQSLGDIPLVGRLRRRQESDLAVWRASNGTFFWIFAAGGFDYAAAHGESNGKLVAWRIGRCSAISTATAVPTRWSGAPPPASGSG